MPRKFVDITVFESRSMEKDGNIDNGYWHNKSNDEKIRAASLMTSVAFKEPDFFTKKVDRSIFSSRKHAG